MSRCVESFNILVLWGTVNIINVKLCMMVLLTELYLFIPLLVTLTIFQGHSSVKQSELKILCSCPTNFKLIRIVKYFS